MFRNRSFTITYALYKGSCSLVLEIRNILRSYYSSDFRGTEFVGRFIGIRINMIDDSIEGCLRVSSDQPKILKLFLVALRKIKIPHRVIYRGKDNLVIWFKHKKPCSYCPLIHSSENSVVKTSLITPLGLLFEFISCGEHNLPEDRFRILLSGRAEELMDYMLTAREQEVLYYAYMRGYYSNPKRITLEELARELGVCKSTLCELLRSAERKIVTAYMRHDLPHLIMSKLLDKSIELPKETVGLTR